MRQFLICSGVHSRPKSLEWLRRAVETRPPEGILFAGGVLDDQRRFTPCSCTAWGLTPADARFIEQFFEALGELKIFTAVIPGPADTPMENFLRLGMGAEIEFPNVHLAHTTLVQKGDVIISGMGGMISQDLVSNQVSPSRTFVEYHLRPLWTASQPHRILLLSLPPTGALGGSEGCPLVGELIDSYHPSLCVVHGPQAQRGVQRVAQTLVINPGHLAEGSAVWLNWNRAAHDQIEWLQLRRFEPTRLTADIGSGV